METNFEPILNKKSTKGIIINILIEKQPQTLKELNSKIQKQKNITYQATHKAIKEMQIEGLLNKKNNFY